MIKIGCHLSSSGGFTAMANTAVTIGANIFQFFTRNPRGGSAKAISTADIEKYNEVAQNNNLQTILAHAPYTINCCAVKENVRQFAIETMADDFKRMELVPGNLYNFHPGSHVGQGIEKGIDMIAEVLNMTLKEDMHTTVLLETMAGKGTEVGSRFEELAAIIDRVTLKDKMGVCLDTCHVYDAGYNIVNDLDGVLNEFDSVIGLERLSAIHLNDSKNPLCSHKDRHEKIGEGTIGIGTFKSIINHPKLKALPFYLETPNELDGYAREIALLKSLYIEA